MRKCTCLVLFLFTFAIRVHAQGVQPAPPLHLLNSGYGAAALGIGGAFVAVADDLSAIYWNPAGLTQLSSIRVSVDYRVASGSEENIGARIAAGPLDISNQPFSLSGNQFQAVAVSYAIRTPGFTIVPAFAFQRLSMIPPNRELQGTATADFAGFISSTGSFRQDFSKGDDEYTLGVGASLTKKVSIGGSWSFVDSGPEETRSGTFRDIDTAPDVILIDDLDLSETIEQDRHGNYFRLAILAAPSKSFSIGGTVRFPHTETLSNIFDGFSATSTFTTQRLDQSGNVISTTTETNTVTDDGVPTVHEAQLDVPMEWSTGVSFRPNSSVLVAGSITYADWSDAAENFPQSPGSQIPYPTLIGDVGNQPSLLQWRGGLQYSLGQPGNRMALRTGYFRDGQPIGTAGERPYFNGFSLGFGYESRIVNADVAFVKENGDVLLTSDSIESSHLSHQRWVFSIAFSGQ